MISVIIPLAPKEQEWTKLIPQLSGLPEDCEIILAIGEDDHVDVSGFENVATARGSQGRAQQMNAGAREAKGEFLWFLHADTILDGSAITRLLDILGQASKALYYYDLKFLTDGPKAMKLNEIAVRWRSDIFKMPFGDQAFAIRRDLFFELGGYREDVAYGEDHLFVWKARHEGYALQRTGACVFTSARKYKKGGWGKVTLLHVWLTVKQGMPEFIKLLKKKLK